MSISNEVLLDWDGISWNECLRRISIIKENNLVEKIDLRMSPINGYHVYITLFQQLHQEHLFRLRRAWKDDGKRLMMDCFWRLGNNKDNSDVMFSKKYKHGVIWYEIPLFLYNRVSFGMSEWQLMNQQTAEQVRLR